MLLIITETFPFFSFADIFLGRDGRSITETDTENIELEEKKNKRNENFKPSISIFKYCFSMGRVKN